MARGAVFLGSGGGGDPYVSELFLRAQLKRGHKARIIELDELDDDAFVISIAGIGAPSVYVEHLVSEKLLLRLFARAEAFFGRRIDALISAEIGGSNSIIPLGVSAICGVPVIDGDGMGRAMPHIEMTTFSIFGARATPAILMDECGTCMILETADDRTAEDVCRAAADSVGAEIMGALYPMSGKLAKTCVVRGTLEQTLQIGRRIREARTASGDVFTELLAYLNTGGRFAKILFDGKIVDVIHETRDGWHWGKVTLSGLRGGGDHLTLEVQNEYTVARLNGRTVTVVPDIISVLDRESGEPLTGEMLRYGQRVKVVGYSSHPLLKRPESLEVMGPRMFGIDEDFVPIEELHASAVTTAGSK